MPRCTVDIGEAYPVYSLFPESNHWASPENWDEMFWWDIPTDLVERVEAARLEWDRAQRRLRNFIENHDHEPVIPV